MTRNEEDDFLTSKKTKNARNLMSRMFSKDSRLYLLETFLDLKINDKDFKKILVPSLYLM